MSGPDLTAGQLPRNFLVPCLLLLLREQPSHGYELLDRLAPLGFTRSDPGRLYRALRELEQEGFVHSAWEPSKEGPDRRIYQLTRAGMEELHHRATSLAFTGDAIGVFLSRYSEFVSLSRAAQPVEAHR